MPDSLLVSARISAARSIPASEKKIDCCINPDPLHLSQSTKDRKDPDEEDTYLVITANLLIATHIMSKDGNVMQAPPSLEVFSFSVVKL